MLLARLWDATVTLLAAQNQGRSNASGAPTLEKAVEIGGPRYSNVRDAPCVVPLVSHEFANSYYNPVVESFHAPPCDEDYSVVYLKWSAACRAGVQYDRIAAVWVNGMELLRTSTAEPSKLFGTTWEVTKDISIYARALRDGGTVVVALDNIVNPTYTSSFKVDLTFEFYRPLDASKQVKQPDRIVPVSSRNKSYGWFSEKPQSALAGPPHRMVQIPDNTEELYLELFLSHHQCDEFFYSNPPDNATMSFAETFRSWANMPIHDIEEQTAFANKCGADGSFREVQVLVDDTVVGVVWPFPLVFTGGLSPYLWKPVVGIGAFNAPTYILNLTPFLGKFLGGVPRAVAFRVIYGESFWLIDGNLFIFEDAEAVHPTRVKVLREHLDRYVEPTVVALPVVTGDGNKKSTELNNALWTSAVRDRYVKTSVTTSAGRKIYTLRQHFDFTNTQMYSSDGLDQWFESHTHVETKMTVSSLSSGYEQPDAKVQTVFVSQLEDYPIAGSVSYHLGENGSFILETKFANSFSRSTVVDGYGTGFRTTPTKTSYRFLGNSGLLVSKLALGSWMWASDEYTMDVWYKMMVTAFNNGVNFFDMAEIYGETLAERNMGGAVKRGIEEGTWSREDLVVTAKLFAGTTAWDRSSPNAQGLCRKHIIEGLKGSLQRMQLDYVNVVFCHRPDALTPIEDTPQYNTLERNKVEFEDLNLYKKYNLGLTVWSPLASGYLTGKYSAPTPDAFCLKAGVRFTSAVTAMHGTR
ncbi:hypothetical protein PHYBOEH_008718 [Phytophthora boehmeriae]|uniref:NADP-dependent oxidoreductase domain-containing protein n=1 Tax=Phytophthora boehmeriae TaxID=109152 RepID=A0A8T1X609_9STRA|nr:hypothetical protein PHYBOEH_008718 [Phytophthora boehmeriae]